MAESEEELKSLLMKVKGESEKAGLKFNIQKAKIMASGPITSWEVDRENVESVRFNFLGLQNQCGWWPQPLNLKILAPWKNSYVRPRQCFKKQRHYFADKGPHSQTYGFSSSHVWMWELDHKENWAPKNWCFWTVVLEKTLESPLDSKGIQPVHLKGNQSWVFIGRTDAEAETPVLWPPDGKNWLIGKDPDTGKDCRWEKEMTEDQMVACHHWLNELEFVQAPWVGDGQGSLVCCRPWGCKQSDTTERLNWTESITSTKRNLTHFSLICFLVTKLYSTVLWPPWTVACQPTLPYSACSWDFPGKKIRVGCHFLLQGIFLTQGSNPHFLHWQADSLPLSHQGSP